MKPILNKIITIGDTKWLIREAVSMVDAEYAIAMARCTGSIGGQHTETYRGTTVIKADVVRLNDDGTECKPA